MSDKAWKQHLLSSGLPLEFTVRRILEDFGLFHPNEFRYERLNEAGQPTVFSVDLNTSKIYTDRNLWIELFIECKYRHDNTRWVFTPHEFSDMWSTEFSDVFVTVDLFADGRTINRTALESLQSYYNLCEKGIEITDKGSNPASLKHGLQQLRYALVEKIISALEHQYHGWLGQPSPLFVHLPILVTTAELWRLQSGTTLERLREADALEDVATKHDLLFVHDPPDSEFQRHTKRRFKDEFPEDQWDAMTADMSQRHGTTKTFAAYVSQVARNYPSMFLIIRHERFRTAMENLFRFFEQEKIIVS